MKSTNRHDSQASLERLWQCFVEGRLQQPLSLLGHHPASTITVRIFRSGARSVWLLAKDKKLHLRRWRNTDLFVLSAKQAALTGNGLIQQDTGATQAATPPYRVHWADQNGEHTGFDCYNFPATLAQTDLQRFNLGLHHHAYRILGPHLRHHLGIAGTRFAVWAPNAKRISVVGDFNQWDGRSHLMTMHPNCGIWELFIPELLGNELYKFELQPQQGDLCFVKTDPFARQFELRPNTAALTVAESAYVWRDNTWMLRRSQWDWLHQPMAVYEVHLGSWRRDHNNGFLNYRDLAQQLVPYAKSMGFTHIELLPVNEHPLDASWGYQATGYFAPSRRFGLADDFRFFVDFCHQHQLGVILDWVPAHFPKDDFALARFDGTALYEHADPRQGEHRDWGTLIFNYGRNEVKSFLISSALFWLEVFHIDGLRVDAVASMLYLDYSRQQGDWLPNRHGGRENLEAIALLRELNIATHAAFPGTLTIAEESTDWAMVSRPTCLGGLGFSMKWNMGWMHDSLRYVKLDPIHRQYHHNEIAFSIVYAFNENFMLPYSHDEVVHGKASMLHKMPGDRWQRFANLRLLYTYMYTHPGKKLLYMGAEFAAQNEWDEAAQLDWSQAKRPLHQGIQLLVSDLNGLYKNQEALHHFDFDGAGFEWIDCHDSVQSVLSYLRKGAHSLAVVVLNFTPVPRYRYRIGVPYSGRYTEIFNSDSHHYGGSNVGNSAALSEPLPWMGQLYSITLTLPPLAGIILIPAAQLPAPQA